MDVVSLSSALLHFDGIHQPVETSDGSMCQLIDQQYAKTNFTRLSLDRRPLPYRQEDTNQQELRARLVILGLWTG